MGLPAGCAGPELLEDELLADEGTAAGRVVGAGRVGAGGCDGRVPLRGSASRPSQPRTSPCE